MIKSAHLLPLTGLRFFAAAAIVLLHSAETWPIPSALGNLALNQGVSFFFVLSGFILAYVYRDIRSFADAREFYVARVARIWPVHIAATLLLFVLLPQYLAGLRVQDGAQITVAYVTLTQAWFPFWNYFLAFNGVSWTISTELFFYLTFPLFIRSWGQWNAAKIPLAALPALLVIVYVNVAQVPATEWTPGLTVHGLIYIFPPSRLVEFVCGVVVAQIWLQRGEAREWSRIKSAALEIAAICFVYIAMRYCRPAADTELAQLIGGTGGAHWLRVNGFTPAFVLMVYVFASSRGPIAAFLGSRLMFRLGEISFSLYMVHTVVLTLFNAYPRTIAAHLPFNSQLAYWLICLACAYCMWRYVETPMRRAIINFYRREPTNFSASVRDLIRRAGHLVAPLLVVFMASTILFPRPEIDLVTGEPSTLTFKPREPVVFGGQYEFLGIHASEYGQNTNFEIYLRAVRPVRLDKTLAVHTFDAAGNILGSGDVLIDRARSDVSAGTTWRVHSTVPTSWLASPRALGIAIYDRDGTMPLSKGTGDWEGRRYRLVMP